MINLSQSDLRRIGVEHVEIGDLQGNIRTIGIGAIIRVSLDGPAPWDGWRFLGGVCLDRVDDTGKIYHDQVRIRFGPDPEVDLEGPPPISRPAPLTYSRDQLRAMGVNRVNVSQKGYEVDEVEYVEIHEEIGMGTVQLNGRLVPVHGEIELERSECHMHMFTAEGPAPLPWPEQIIETVACRGSAYGTPSSNHQLTANLWSAWLTRRMGIPIAFSAEDVCMLNILQKASRLAERTKDDSWLDIMGYSENVSRLEPEQRNGSLPL
jgi:hypothetical protein